MSTAAPVAPRVASLPLRRAPSVAAVPRAESLARIADYLSLTKPRIAAMVLVTVSVGYAVGCAGEFDLPGLLDALAGIGLVAAGSSALNQWLERRTDGRMFRTVNRPLPAGRIHPLEALVFGVLLGVAGSVWLLLRVNGLTAALTVATLLMYVGLYTPLKRRTSLCTAIGAIPGALPPVLGWTAAGGELNASALALFGILFLWQFPHFLAIAWLYREDYRLGGLRMLPRHPQGTVVGRLAVTYALVLIPVSLLPRVAGFAGDGYFLAALVLGLGYLLAAVAFAREESRKRARRLLWASLIYLPVLLAALTIDHWRLLN